MTSTQQTHVDFALRGMAWAVERLQQLALYEGVHQMAKAVEALET